MEYKPRRSKLDNSLFSGCGSVSGTLMTYLRRKARERKLLWTLTPEFLWDLFLKQEGKCALSGVPLELTTEVNHQHNLDRTKIIASLDRIDNSGSYTEGNVQWVHKIVNRMRRQWSVEDYIYWCRKVVEKNGP